MKQAKLFYSSALDDQKRAKFATKRFIDADGFDCVAWTTLDQNRRAIRIVSLAEQYEAILKKRGQAVAAKSNARHAMNSIRAAPLNWAAPASH